MIRTAWFGVIAMLAAGLGFVIADQWAGADSNLPDMGPAAPFTLTTQDGKPLSLNDLRGKVVLVNFFFAQCRDVCLTSTAKLAMVQKSLGDDFGRRVQFLSVTMDPEEDTPDVLKSHAKRFGARLEGWAFLTGSEEQVRQVARHYGVAYQKLAAGEIQHNTLASIVDSRGHLRVQYMGIKFDPGEMHGDLVALIQRG